MFMWMNLPLSMIRKTAKRMRVTATNPIRTKQEVLLTAIAVERAAGAIVGIGRGVGVVKGGSEMIFDAISYECTKLQSPKLEVNWQSIEERF